MWNWASCSYMQAHENYAGIPQCWLWRTFTAALQQSQEGKPLPQALQAFHHSLLCPEGCSTAEASAGRLIRLSTLMIECLSQCNADHSRPQADDERSWVSHGPIRQWLS